MSELKRVVIAGAGAWGSALALQALRAGMPAQLLAREPTALQAGAAFPRLPGEIIPAALRTGALAALPDLLSEDALVLIAVPMAHARAVLGQCGRAGGILLACKGFEQDSHLLPHEIAAAVQPAIPRAILTGPNFASGIAAGHPAAATIAGADERARGQMIACLASPTLRLYGNDDATGAAVGGAAKNVAAIAAGAVIGAGLGENARAAVITRALAEIGRLAASLGGRAETTAGLSGLGDLVLTCTSSQSRNYRLGLALGEGQSLATAMPRDGSAVEGAYTAPAMLARAGGLELPITAAVAALLGGSLTLPQAITALLTRPRRDE